MSDIDGSGKMSWWSKQSTGGKAIMGIAGLCCIGIILFVVIGGLLAPDSTTTTSSSSNDSSANVTQETTPAPAPTETEAQYKASCKKISYKQLEKNPDKYTGQRVKFTGTVFQIQESGDFTSILLDVGGYDNVSVLYDGTTNAVEDSTITIYGEIMGSYTYESVAGYQITVPQMNAKYIVTSQES